MNEIISIPAWMFYVACILSGFGSLLGCMVGIVLIDSLRRIAKWYRS